MGYVGDFPVGAIVQLIWDTTGLNGASISRATDGTLKIYRDASPAERLSLAGVTQAEDFDAATGVHTIIIDTSNNTDPGFYAAGHDYQVTMTGMVIDGTTINAAVGSFSIQNRTGATAGLTSVLTESYAADGAIGATAAQLLYEIRALLAEKSIVGVTMTTRKLDGSTQAATYTMNSATTPTSITRSS